MDYTKLTAGAVLAVMLYFSLSVGAGGCQRFSSITVEPESPDINKYAYVHVLDNDGRPSINAKVEIKRMESDGVRDREENVLRLDSAGGRDIRFILSRQFKNPYGLYEVEVSHIGYCDDSITFEVVKNRSISFSDTTPLKPVPGKPVKLRVLDEDGLGVSDVGVVVSGDWGFSGEYLSDRTGSVYLMLEEAGEYLLQAQKEGYPMAAKTLVVSSLPLITLSIEPAELVVGETALIRALSGNRTLSSVNLSVTGPNVSESFSVGEVNFTPPNPGTFTVSCAKGNFFPAEKTLRAYNLLSIVLPAGIEDKSGEEVEISVVDQGNGSVAYANVSTSGGISGVSDESGRFRFRLPELSEVEIVATKEGYMAYETLVHPKPKFRIMLSKEGVVLGDIIEVSVVDDTGILLESDITITSPSKKSESYHADALTYKPAESGEYAIKVLNKTTSFVVRPRPLSLSAELTGRRLTVRLTSRGRPVSGVGVWIDSPSGRVKLISNYDGVAVYDVGEEGKYKVSVNDSGYTPSEDVVFYSKGSGSLLLFVAAAFILFLCAIFFTLLVLKRDMVSIKKKQRPKPPSLRGV